MIARFARFARFALVGAFGFLVDAGVLLLVRAATGLDLYSARLISFLAAATVTWALNRRYTFAPTTDRPVAQWLRFLLANAAGGLVNYGTYAALVAGVPLCARYPALAVGAGSLAGLAINFANSSVFVFGRPTPGAPPAPTSAP